MKKFILAICTLFTMGLNASAQQTWNEGIHIIPLPAEMQMKQGAFTLDKNTVILTQAKELTDIAQLLSEKLAKPTQWNLAVKSTGKYANSIQLVLNSSIQKEEGYHLTVNANQVRIEGKTPEGVFYGMQTFLQLLPAEVESQVPVSGMQWKAQACDIQDAPTYSYRGFHVDPCRHFWTVEETKKIIDAMSMFKANKMHWHLTEDQGWRIEIKKYPKLTEIGGVRTEGDGTQYGGYYTQDQIKEIVAYAAKRYIEIIPEVDLPGHMCAALAAYPELSCSGMKLKPRIVWGVEDIVMCPGKEDMFNFLQDVFNEMAPLFPSKYFHVGGDECPKTEWAKCPLCQARIKAEGIQATPDHTAEQGLQTYVLKRVQKMLAKHGKQIIGWDEILEGGLDSGNSTIMSWRGTKGGIAAATQGHDAIMTPSSEGMYLDFYQGDNKIEPTAIGGYATLKKVYTYNPMPDTLKTLKQESHILGIQGNTWTEYIKTPEVLEYRMFPRIIAIMETGWTPNEKKNYDDFERRLNNALVRLGEHHINYYIPQPEQPNGSCNFVAFTDAAKLEFKTSYPHTIIYTLDGSTPKPGSPVYQEPLTFQKSTTLKICTLLPWGKTSPVRTILVEKQSLYPATTLAEKHQGLKMKKTYGVYLDSKQLEKATDWQELIIQKFQEISHQEPTTEDMRNAKYYSAIAEGYVEIPADGVYYISSNNDEVWIDGKLLVNNAREVKRYSRHDSSMALAKGLHKIKIVFCGNISGGIPTQWGDGSVNLRKSDVQKFEPIKPDQLFY